VRPNLENDVYLGLMAAAEALVGNSSAAIVEAPYLRLPAVNVGERQAGRARPANVIDADATARSIAAALSRARALRAHLQPPPTSGLAAERIVEVLKATELELRLLRKELV